MKPSIQKLYFPAKNVLPDKNYCETFANLAISFFFALSGAGDRVAAVGEKEGAAGEDLADEPDVQPELDGQQGGTESFRF